MEGITKTGQQIGYPVSPQHKSRASNTVPQIKSQKCSKASEPK